MAIPDSTTPNSRRVPLLVLGNANLRPVERSRDVPPGTLECTQARLLADGQLARAVDVLVKALDATVRGFERCLELRGAFAERIGASRRRGP